MEMITGRVFKLGDAKLVPLWDAPVLVAERDAVPLAPGPLPKFGPNPHALRHQRRMGNVRAAAIAMSKCRCLFHAISPKRFCNFFGLLSLARI